MNEVKVARGLGWFSIGLGLAEVLATNQLADFLGTTSRTGVIRAFGIRELAAGVGILAQPHPTAPWLWARVGGDLMDIVSLGVAYQNHESKRKAIGFALGNVLAVTVLDILCARQLSERRIATDGRRTGRSGAIAFESTDLGEQIQS